MQKSFSALAAAVLCAIPAFANHDFSPELLARAKNGEIIIENLSDSNRDYKMRFRAFVPRTNAEAFVKLVTTHANFPAWIPEVRKAETVAVEENGNAFRYRAEVFINMGIIQQTLTPEGLQRVSRPANAAGDTLINNAITNYTDQVVSAEERTRISPEGDGILTDTTVEVNGRNELPAFMGQLVRREARARCKRLIERLRGQLTGN